MIYTDSTKLNEFNPIFPIVEMPLYNTVFKICAFSGLGVNTYNFPTLRAYEGICSYVYNCPILNPLNPGTCDDPNLSNAPITTATYSSSSGLLTFSETANCLCYGVRPKKFVITPSSMDKNKVKGSLYSTYDSQIHIRSLPNTRNVNYYGCSFSNNATSSIITIDKTHPGKIYAGSWCVCICNNCTIPESSLWTIVSHSGWLTGYTSSDNWVSTDKLYWKPWESESGLNESYIEYVNSNNVIKYVGGGFGQPIMGVRNLGAINASDKAYLVYWYYAPFNGIDPYINDVGQPGAFLPPSLLVDCSSLPNGGKASVVITQYGTTISKSPLLPTLTF